MRNLFRVLLLASVALYAVMALWSFPLITANAEGIEAFDLRFLGYSIDEARAFLTALNDTGRAHYINIQHRLDLIYPAVLSLALLVGILRFGARLSASMRILLAVIPLAAGAADYTENALVGQMLSLPVSEVTDAVITQASLVTVLKSGLYAISIVLLVVLGLTFAIRRRRNIRHRREHEAKF